MASAQCSVIGVQFGCVLEFITNKSQEGSQFCRGFGGIGGILRYSVDPTLNEVSGIPVSQSLQS